MENKGKVYYENGLLMVVRGNELIHCEIVDEEDMKGKKDVVYKEKPVNTEKITVENKGKVYYENGLLMVIKNNELVHCEVVDEEEMLEDVLCELEEVGLIGLKISW